MRNSTEIKLSLHTTLLDISSELILFCELVLEILEKWSGKSGSDSDEDEIVARDLFLAVGVLCFTCGSFGFPY